jgi:hypothetical protein
VEGPKVTIGQGCIKPMVFLKKQKNLVFWFEPAFLWIKPGFL